MNAPTANRPDRPPNRPFAARPSSQIILGCLIIPLLVVGAIAGLFFSLRAQASATLTIPAKSVLLVYAGPDPSDPLLARFGPGQQLPMLGRSADWDWLQVELWDGRPGWAGRPLDILVWQLEAPITEPASASSPAPTVSLREEEMVAIPGTTFTMGSPPGLGEADEMPAHVVSLSSFKIDRTEVALGHYWQCVQAGACLAPTNPASQTRPHYLNDPIYDNYPVINVPWHEANNYCAWRGKRLPTEAEWEMAAGWDAGKQAKLLWPWGNEADSGRAGDPSNLGPTSAGDTVPVSSRPADRSAAGLLDLGGNVSEWVFDWYKVDYYSVADDSDPIGPSHRRGEGSGRAVRGGSFADPVSEARSGNRRHQAEDYGYLTVGFRCAQDAE